MVKVDGRPLDIQSLSFPPDSIEAQVLSIMDRSTETYQYETQEQLKFELTLRRNIVNAARELNRSAFAFRVFRKSFANPDYWHRTNEGGFELLPDVQPYDAINDIFRNSTRYGSECSTAMVIIYYKALADMMPRELFNQLFSGIYLMNWQHLDRDLGISTYDRPADYFPGDARYVKNPDVDPLTPQWQGENIFDMGGGQYYGHGIGITTIDRIVAALNTARVEGSTRSAYLMDMAERPNFKHLAKKYSDYMASHPATASWATVSPQSP